MSLDFTSRAEVGAPLLARRRVLGLLAAGGAVGLTTALAGPAVGASAAVRGAPLAPPTGPWAVGTTTSRMVDATRADPFTGGRREVMLQFWYPTSSPRDHRRALYVSRAVARRLDEGLGISDPGRFAHLRPHARVGAAVAAPRVGLPLVLYSHGSGSYRESATAVAEDLASHGYAVVAIDHTHDSVAVEFPGGRIVPMGTAVQAGWSESELADRLDDLRAGDIQATVDHLVRGGVGGGGHPLRGRVDPRRIGAFGHSRGGSAVSAAMGSDERIVAGLGVDSSFATAVAGTGLDRPFMLFTERHLGPEDGPHATHWQAFRTNQRGWGRHLELLDSGHWTFMDPAPLLAFLGTRHHISAELVDDFFGPVALRRRAVPITRTYVRALFDRHLRGKAAPILDGPSPRFPEIRFLWSSGR